MNQQQFIEKTKTICHLLNQRRHQDNFLFSDNEMPYYWKLSELTNLYPSKFNMQTPISSNEIYKMELTIFDNIPELKNLNPHPNHLLNVKENYTLKDHDTKNVKIIKNSLNQNLSCVMCEYLFGTQHYYIEQAYFLFPNETPEKIANAARDLKTADLRPQITNYVKKLTSIINNSINTSTTSYNAVWSEIWNTLYNTYSISNLRETYNIKGSPIDYMTPTALHVTNNMLKNITEECSHTYPLNTEKIINIARKWAIHARNQFINHNTYPCMHLSKQKTQTKIKNIITARENFWRKNYPLSLQK